MNLSGKQDLPFGKDVEIKMENREDKKKVTLLYREGVSCPGAVNVDEFEG